MSRMSRDEEDRLAREFEEEAGKDELWEEIPAPNQAGQRKTLGTQVTIRLDAESAARLRQIARHHGVGYTSLVRSWVEERLHVEATAALRVGKPQMTMAGESGTWTLFRRSFQLSGNARILGAGG
jgi:hypothetical protein